MKNINIKRIAAMMIVVVVVCSSFNSCGSDVAALVKLLESAGENETPSASGEVNIADAISGILKGGEITYLSEVKCQNSSRYTQVNSGAQLEDTIGNKYSVSDHLFKMESYNDDNRWDSYDYDGYADYYLGGKYKTLQGVIAVNDTSSNRNCTFTIVGDDVILYTLTVDRLTAPVNIDVDLSNINVLTIVLCRPENKGSMSVILSDFYFTE